MLYLKDENSNIPNINYKKNTIYTPRPNQQFLDFFPFALSSLLSFFLWGKVSLCSPNYSQICGNPLASPIVLGLYAHTGTPNFMHGHWVSFKPGFPFLGGKHFTQKVTSSPSGMWVLYNHLEMLERPIVLSLDQTSLHPISVPFVPSLMLLPDRITKIQVI